MTNRQKTHACAAWVFEKVEKRQQTTGIFNQITKILVPVSGT